MAVCLEDFVYRDFKERDNIWFRNSSSKKEKWLPGNVIEKTGAHSYIIASNNGTTRRHTGQLGPCSTFKATRNLY